jgi:hypothetical protein
LNIVILLRGIMRLSRAAALSAVAAIGLAMTFAGAPAQAAKKKAYVRNVTERITVIDETGRVRTKVTVRPRSFLDPGKETLAFDQHYHDYATTPGQSMFYDRNDWKGSWSRMPLPGAWDVPGWTR